MFDTIAAVATPPGEGGIGIIRVSGPEALSIARRVFRGAEGDGWVHRGGYRLVYGHVVEPRTGEVVDEVLLGIMRAPRSYTREDVVEFNCHGGWVAVGRVLELVLRSGARLAEPGEFTRRAFLNGRIDLTQAEAVLDIVRSRSREAMQVAVAQLRGFLGQKVREMREELLGLQAAIEASIDFPEEVAPPGEEELRGRLSRVREEIKALLATAEAGRLYREGLAVVIIGKPNVGKSSLLNRLLREDRALVTEVPGTTRDVVEELARIGGFPVRLADTAGVRETEDVVEKLGIERTRRKVAAADLVLLVLDATREIDDADREAAKLSAGKRRILVVNKIDAAPAGPAKEELAALGGTDPVVYVSALEGTGMAELEKAIGESVMRLPRLEGTAVVSNVRHRAALVRAQECIEDALEAGRSGIPLDVMGIDIYGALEALGEIIGVTGNEEVIERVFADFCVGK